MALVFTIIKILGLVLLALLAFTLITLVIALFAPLKLELTADKNGELRAKGSLKWLFSLVGFNIAYLGDNIDYSFYYPLKSLLTGERKQKPKKPKRKKQAPPPPKASPSQNEVSKPKSVDQSPQSEASKSHTAEPLKKPEEKTSHKGKPRKKKKKTGPSFIGSLKDIVEQFKAIENKKEILDCFIKNAKFFLSHIKFDIIKLRLVFGFEDPSLTGKVLGILYSLGIPFLKGVHINADFEKAIFETDVNIKGKTNLFFVLLPILKFILNKNIRKIIF